MNLTPALRRCTAGLCWLAVAASVGTILLGLATVSTSYLRTLHADEWVNATFYLDRGFWASIFYRHYSHPLILTNLILRIDWVMLGGSGAFRSWTTALLSGAAATAVAAISLAGGHRLTRQGRRILLAGAFVVASMGWWLGMGMKILWVFGTTDHLAALGAAICGLGFLNLDRDRPWGGGFAAMVAGSVVATFSFGTGLAVWVAYAVCLGISRAPLRVTLTYLAVAVGAVLMAMLVIPSYGAGTDGIPGLSAPPVDLLIVVVGVLGNAWANVALMLDVTPDAAGAMTVSGVLGILGLVTLLGALLLAWWRRECDAADLALAGVALVAVGGAAMIALTRVGEFGTGIAIAPRYGPISTLFWLALVGWTTRQFARQTSPPTIRPAAALAGSWVLVSLAVALLATNYLLVAHFKQLQRNNTLTAVGLVVDPTPENAVIWTSFAKGPLLARVIGQMRADHLDAYRTPLARVMNKPVTALLDRPGQVLECVGAIAPDTRRPIAGSIVLNGWAVERRSRTPVSAVYAVKDGVVRGGGERGWRFLAAWRQPETGAGGAFRTSLARYLPNIALALELPAGGWFGVVKGAPADLPTFTYYGVLQTDRLCRIVHGL